MSEEQNLQNDVPGPIESEYKGNPILTLNPESRYPFSFGLSKAKLVIQYIEEIKAFIQKHDK